MRRDVSLSALIALFFLATLTCGGWLRIINDLVRWFNGG